VPEACAWSSAARSRESMLSVLSDMCQAEPGLSAERGVAHTNTDRYLSCSRDDVVSEVDAASRKFMLHIITILIDFRIYFFLVHLIK
jgi:hypothetical protein